jgi:large subunit ribosomal protein L22
MVMEVQALTKYARMSPKKLLEVARNLRGLSANEGLDVLQFIPRKSAVLIRKTLVSAIANAENNHELSASNLYIQNVLIEQGPRLRRFRPAPRGMAHPYNRYTSHIRVILGTKG